jgi:hypothetical protein
MTSDPRDLSPFDGEAPHFRIDPEDPAVEAEGLTLYGPDTPGYRRVPSKQFWEDWFNTDGMTLETTKPHRIRVAWRILRAQAALRGVLTHPRQFLGDAVRNVWWQPFHLMGQLSADQTVNAICTGTQLPVLPPDVPAPYLNGTVKKDYDPDRDERLNAYIRLIEHVARRLGIARTRDGRMGLAGLTNPRMVRAAMPLPSEIVEFERHVVNGALDQLLAHGDHEMDAWLRQQHELTDVEIDSVRHMVRHYARDRSGVDDHMDVIALDTLRMDRIHAKQMEQEDFRGAVQTLRDKGRLLLAAKQGVKNTDEEDFGAIVEAEIAREKKKALPPPDPGGKLEEDLPPN